MINYSELYRTISQARFGTYEAIVGKNKVDEALLLYRLNTVLSGTFLFPIQSLEISLRNALADELNCFFERDDWLVTVLEPEDYYVADDRNPKFWTENQVEKIDGTRKRLRNNGKEITQGRLIADLDFGFWILFLEKHHHRLWTRLKKSFPNLPENMTRGQVHERLIELRNFRNRIAHHEIIVNHPDTLSVVSERFLETIRWISHDKAEWTKINSHVDSVWREILRKSKKCGWEIS